MNGVQNDANRIMFPCAKPVGNLMATDDLLSCPMCLAVYLRHKQRRTEKSKGRFVCTCGHTIATWKGFVVPIFTKIKESTLLAN